MRLEVAGVQNFVGKDEALFEKSVITICNCKKDTVNLADVELRYQLRFPCSAPAGLDGPILRMPGNLFGRDLKPEREVIMDWTNLQQEKNSRLKDVESVKLAITDGSNSPVSDTGRAVFSLFYNGEFQSNYTRILDYVIEDGPLCASGGSYRASIVPA